MLIFCVNGRKWHFLSSSRQQEKLWLTVKTVSEKQNRDTDLWLELLENYNVSKISTNLDKELGIMT